MYSKSIPIEKVYKNQRGLLLPEYSVIAHLNTIKKTEKECEKFFGEVLWWTPGFAIHWASMTDNAVRYFDYQV